MRRISLKFIILMIIFSLLVLIAIPTQAVENDALNEITGFLGEQSLTRAVRPGQDHYEYKWFYIKNACTGQYMDVSGGVAQSGTNVWQYKYNGTDSQKWYLNNNGDGTFTLYSALGNNLVLDIADASNANQANVQVWEYNGTDAQKFKIGTTTKNVYAILTKVSNYEKCVVTEGSNCTEGHNINQYEFGNNWTELWILEPVIMDVDLGAYYATANYNSYVEAYPNLTNIGGDCTNFVSQCMLASGIHSRDDWYIYRKNLNYTNISNTSQLNNSFELSDPSPWISAEEFKDFWVSRTTNGAYRATGQQILDNPDVVWSKPITQGCVIQKADNWFGNIGTVRHSMYITGYLNDGVDNTFLLTYHSTNTLNKSLKDICSQDPDSYYLIYTF